MDYPFLSDPFPGSLYPPTTQFKRLLLRRNVPRDEITHLLMQPVYDGVQRSRQAMFNFVLNNNMANEANFAQLKEMLDLQNYIDPLLIRVYWNETKSTISKPFCTRQGAAHMRRSGAPSYTIGGGALSVTLGSNTVILANTGGDFDTQHLRVNDPLGASLIFTLPTPGFEAITPDFDTRRSGQGAGRQQLAYTTNGIDWIDYAEYDVFNAPPQPQSFDFSDIEGASDDPDFGVRIVFELTGGSNSGNHRFDDIVLRGVALPGVNLPLQIVGSLGDLLTGVESIPIEIDLNTIFSDPDEGPLLDIVDEGGAPVEYLRNATEGHTALLKALLPPEALDEPYVQLLWRYSRVSGTSGSRAQLRLDDIRVGEEPVGFRRWQILNFSAAERENPGISGPLADPEESGLPNLLRYALGLSRYEPFVGLLPRPGHEPGIDGVEIRYIYRRLLDPDTGVAYHIEVSEDLPDPDAWELAEIGVHIRDAGMAFATGDGITEEVTLVLVTEAIDATRMIRLRVVLADTE